MPGCSAYGCSNSDKKGFCMKVFPRDPERRSIWAKNVRRDQWEPTNKSHLCEVHFTADQWEKTRVDGTRKLKFNAIPTLFCFNKPAKTKENSLYPSRVKKLKDSEEAPMPLEAVKETQLQDIQQAEHNYGKTIVKDDASKQSKKRKPAIKNSPREKQPKATGTTPVAMEQQPTEPQVLKQSVQNMETSPKADIVEGVEQCVAKSPKNRDPSTCRFILPKKPLTDSVDTPVLEVASEEQPTQSQILEQPEHNDNDNAATVIVELEPAIVETQELTPVTCPLPTQQIEYVTVESSIPIEKTSEQSENLEHSEPENGNDHFTDVAAANETTQSHDIVEGVEHYDSNAQETVILVYNFEPSSSTNYRFILPKLPGQDSVETTAAADKQLQHNGNSNAASIIADVEDAIIKTREQMRRSTTTTYPLPVQQQQQLNVESPVAVAKQAEQSEHEHGSSHVADISEIVQPPEHVYESTRTNSNDMEEGTVKGRITVLETKVREYESCMAKLRGEVYRLKLKLKAKATAEFRQRQTNKTPFEDSVRRIFNEDQIRYLKNSKMTRGWSMESIEMAIALKSSCSRNGYKKLLELGLPFPSLRTLRRMQQVRVECEAISHITDPTNM